ncbi:DNA repair protein Rad18 [Apiospora hydei]|uniref:DNA repair protein Rad18 n=1 Tax=Apiospora hydei TaxID=1337664 RepID=A0ABR1WM18_9PEZI
MPSASRVKRSRAAFDEEDAEDRTAHASSSKGAHLLRKKARVSDADTSRSSGRLRHNGQPNSDDDDEIEEEEVEDEIEEEEVEDEIEEDDNDVMRDTEAPPTPPPATQYETMRDAGFQHLWHLDEDDMRATQRLKSRQLPEQIGDNVAALNAVIESITCYNFMCHTRLHCDLGPLLNFIVGENGSGKSAILTAITLCLGGKASSTNRGASLRSFIKEGQDHASLVVKIKNQGSDAYKPDLFGESIIVERNFNRSGSSGFKLKSATGRVVTTKKSDVDDVVEYYCLQVDNPLNVLSQDNARQFLNSASPTTKYKYFLQGTQLEQLDNDLQLFAELMEANENKLVEYEETVTYLKDKFEKARAIKEACDKNEELRRKSRLYVQQLSWAQVAEQETILEEKENAIEAAESEIARLQQEAEAKTEVLAARDEKIQQAEQAADAITQEEASFEEKHAEADAKFRAAKGEIEELHVQERELRSQAKQAKHSVDDKKEKIKEEERQLEEVNGGAAAEAERAVDEAKKAQEDADNNLNDHKDAEPSLREEMIKAEEQVAEASKLVEQKRKEVNAAEGRLRQLSQSRIDSLAGYEPHMAQLLKNIENDRGFQDQPIGPLGLHIKLKKPDWTFILEKVLNDPLNGFIVTNPHDQKRLIEHMRRLRMDKNAIYISKPGFSLNALREPDAGFETILRVLDIDDPRVRDQLVLVARIEQIVLMPRAADVWATLGDRGAPPGVASILALHDTDRNAFMRFQPKGSNNLQSTAEGVYNGASRMKSDSETQISVQKRQHEQLQMDLKELNQSMRLTQQHAQKCSLAVTQHKRQEKALDRQVRAAGVALSDAQSALDAFDGVDARLQALRENLVEAERNYEHYGRQYAEIAVLKEEKNKIVSTLKAELRAAKEEWEDYKARKGKAMDKLQRYKDLRHIALTEKNSAIEHIDIAKIEKQDAEGARDEQKELVHEFITNAQKYNPERVIIPEGETYDTIEKKFTALKLQLKRMRDSLGGTEEEINNRIIQAAEEYNAASRNQQNLGSLMVELKQALSKRLDKWRAFQRLISAQSRANFQYLLSERGFRGKLLLDHANKKLEIRVEPDETRNNVSGRNTKTLSGGEKSFSSICLLLAIWDAMGSPLRCLDEFDVFMDNVNRAISTNMLVEAARRSVGKQFILITPNAIEGRAKVAEDVKIIR